MTPNTHKRERKRKGHMLHFYVEVQGCMPQGAGNPYAGCWKPLSTSNGFGVQLTETISGFMQGA
ncbi:hypothetical protein MTR_1g101510 [Medicago truncatula]|uniref:Uncharacterized protein n=1 Tax=Medicago truncatula TaxID=3880 RepID=G7IAR2_MEDTR|nr:hypothetical protein MTR_1g101510 [Medicago truncatula]